VVGVAAGDVPAGQAPDSVAAALIGVTTPSVFRAASAFACVARYRLDLRRVSARLDDPDLQLIAAMREPPPLEDARGSLEFWRQRRSSLPIYRRNARREADEMISRWRERVLAAEQIRYGSGPLGLVRRLLAGDVPSWRVTGAGLATGAWRLVPRWLRLAAVAFASLSLLLAALILVAIAQLIG
jgi:hypothetical protein